MLEDQVVDFFTKSLRHLRVEKLRDLLELKSVNVFIKGSVIIIKT